MPATTAPKRPLIGVSSIGIRPCLEPLYVTYHGHVRRVYGYIPAHHQGHRYWVLRFKRGSEPKTASLTVFGPRGQAHVRAVVVRSDKVRLVPCRPRMSGRRGRPRLEARV